MSQTLVIADASAFPAFKLRLEMSIDEFLNEISSKLPPAPQKKLADFEAELGMRLPDDYRRFLLACNGGHIGGRYWFRGRTPEGQEVEAGVHHIGGFRKESYFSLNSARECYCDRIPNSVIWIMDDPFGNAICLGIGGSHRGRVYFWDHENEPDPDDWDGMLETAGNIRLLAESFTDFVAGLAPLTDE